MNLQREGLTAIVIIRRKAVAARLNLFRSEENSSSFTIISRKLRVSVDGSRESGVGERSTFWKRPAKSGGEKPAYIEPKMALLFAGGRSSAHCS